MAERICHDALSFRAPTFGRGSFPFLIAKLSDQKNLLLVTLVTVGIGALREFGPVTRGMGHEDNYRLYHPELRPGRRPSTHY